MCKYRIRNKCSLTEVICPWAFWCGAIRDYKERDSYKTYCKILKNATVKEKPDGYYDVKFERHGYLYVDFNGEVIKVENIFNDIPKFVKIKKTKTSYKVMK